MINYLVNMIMVTSVTPAPFPESPISKASIFDLMFLHISLIMFDRIIQLHCYDKIFIDFLYFKHVYVCICVCYVDVTYVDILIN